MEAWGKEVAIDKPAGAQKVWKQELSREKILQGFGLTELSLASLAERLVADNTLVQEEAQESAPQFPEEGEKDESDLDLY